VKRKIRILRRITLTAALCAAVLHLAAAGGSDDFERQRSLFKQVFEAAERGEWSAVSGLPQNEQDILENYILWPDLRAAYLRATIRHGDDHETEAFLNRYGTLKPARDLRYRYALDRVLRGDLADYFDIYQAYYQGLDIAKLDCLALQAEIAVGRGNRIANRGKDLWLVGQSQVDECDPVFDYLSANALLTTSDFEERYELAIDAREFALAKWLGESINEAHVEAARLWSLAQTNPDNFLRSHAGRPNSDTARKQLVYAVERLTYRDPELALERWSDVSKRYIFSEEQKHKTARHIALWTARDDLPGAYMQLIKLPVAAQDDEVMRWRARTSLRAQEWLNLLADIKAMMPEERDSEEWRYWRSVALQNSGQVNAANSGFERLSAERSYYGFLAADALQQSYSFEHSALSVDERLIETLADRSDLIRARELFLVGLDSRGRSEWDAVIAYFTPHQKAQAAVLADRWGWHSRAISTAASIGEYDDLSLRYPLPFKKTFEKHATNASIATTWAYGIARSESLFMRDIRSSAGAIGLMQLMPATGRTVARQINLPYFGLDTLTDPDANIRLGTTYLGQMAQRYGGNRVLATAAYNAGPQRVDRWVPEQGSIDARIWIENIPFNETREYVRRVMAAETIFHWRLNGTTHRLSDALPDVEPLADDQRMASVESIAKDQRVVSAKR